MKLKRGKDLTEP